MKFGNILLLAVSFINWMGAVNSDESLLNNQQTQNDSLLEASDSNSRGSASLQYPHTRWKWGNLLSKGSASGSALTAPIIKNSDVREHRPRNRMKNHIKCSIKHYVTLGRKCNSKLVCFKALGCALGFKLHPRFQSLVNNVLLESKLTGNRTITRRESSLVTCKRYRGYDDGTDDTIHTYRGPSTVHLNSVSGVSLSVRGKACVQKELVTSLFESMLDNIIESWDPIEEPKREEVFLYSADVKVDTKDQKKKKPAPPSTGTTAQGGGSKTAKTKKTRSRQDIYDGSQSPSLSQTNIQSWWMSPDERATIRFKNGNMYEGAISMKTMHGNGRFQWADGTVYLGQFKDNAITGKGIIQWKDDTWYEGEFVNNLRHGHGLYVDSRQQRCYYGDWESSTKHGLGVMHYDGTFKNSYDGEWNRNIRDGCGVREYFHLSGYKGEWNKYIQEGEGLMIWPNHDVYKGQWDNGVMNGSGIYVWETYFNSTLSVASLNTYRGFWKHGKRNGHGLLDLGLCGAFYKGEFTFNKKDGVGKFVTNNGLTLQSRELFIDDYFNAHAFYENNETHVRRKTTVVAEPSPFNICDYSIGLLYHIQQALHDIDDIKEARAIIISDYFDNNGIQVEMSQFKLKEAYKSKIISIIEFEEVSLRKALECYRKTITDIYNMYSTICNKEEVSFTPVLIRLFMWQLYYDCKVIEKGLTFVEIDKMYHENPQWLSRSAHDPFEKIFMWQFVHSLITVAKRLYAQKYLPSTKPDTILGKAFRMFMDTDVLPNIGMRMGKLVQGYFETMPLKVMYKLYRSLGEPHTLRTFLRAVRYPAHWSDIEQPSMRDEEELPFGRNMYVIGDGLNYVADHYLPNMDDIHKEEFDLKLFNFGNLTSKSVINIFSSIFPQVYQKEKLVNLDIKITFFEFFEAFVLCAEESIKVKDEEFRLEHLHVESGISQTTQTRVVHKNK